MQDPLEQLPPLLQPIITALEEGALDRACSLFASLGPWHALAQELITGQARLFCCYLDAHLFSPSFAEWSMMSQQLLRFLEIHTPYMVYHEELVAQLQLLERRAHELQSAWKRNKGSLKSEDPPWIRAARSLLPVDLELRLPLHTPLFSEGANKTRVIDATSLAAGILPDQKGGWLCSCPFALVLALKATKGLKPRSVFCAGLDRPLLTAPLAELAALSKQAPDLQPYLQPLEREKLAKALENRSRRALFKRYGARSRLALLYRFQCQDWHEGLARRHLQLPFDPLPEELSALVHEGSVQAQKSAWAGWVGDSGRTPKKLPRVVHLCSQLADVGHAPSKLLYQLLSLHNPERFDTAVVVTEALGLRSGDYPLTLRHSLPTTERGKKFFQLFDRSNLAYLVEVPGPEDSFERLLERLVERLLPLEIDLLVFHGPEPLHHAIAARMPSAVRVLFEHGTLPSAPGFDHAICCLEDSESLWAEALSKWNCKIAILPFGSDARWNWQPEIPQKRAYGIHEDAMVATTISNHLPQRLTREFCAVVSAILRRCPQLVYAPIGPLGASPVGASPMGAQKERILARFDPKVRSRVHFLGSQEQPANIARFMDLYFNEFPFGSCLGILDAMASGCAVVSMYDPKGPPQARYGGLFCGLDQAITSLDPQDYVERACDLYHHPLKFFDASQRAYQGYEWRSNLWAYVERFENHLERMLTHRH